MSFPLRSAASTEGRRMAGARALWRANGMKEEQFGKPIIAVVNSFTQFVPGHTHLHELKEALYPSILLHSSCSSMYFLIVSSFTCPIVSA